MLQDDTLGQISSTRIIAGRIAQQTLECAHFIRDYSEKKSFWKRLGKNTASETDDLTARYNKALDDLMQQFRGQAICNIAYLVRFTSKDSDVLLTFHPLIPLQDSKAERYKRVFSTIACDLAGRDRGMKRALANAVKNSPALKSTGDIIQQWHKLFIEPPKELSGSSAEPVLILIEALDESGGLETRRDLLHILSGTLKVAGVPHISELPSNFRILVTSRLLRDIDH
ncbi:hypothetical protein BDR07DRAFT_1381752 [Suillus spraguei]|nr:hypothetical protein BDR07DRAFT_1381752 [Suillus spraguei]